MLRKDKIEQVAERPLDQRQIMQLDKGGTSIDYISGESMIDLLNEAFGPFWSCEFDKPEAVHYAPVNSRSGKYNPQEVIQVKCTITVPFYDDETKSTVTVKREGFGTATLKAHGEDMAVKTAQTDAMKKAAYSFGIAAELFFYKKDRNGIPTKEAGYFNEMHRGAWSKENAEKHAKEFAIIKEFASKNNIKSMNKIAALALDNPQAFLTPRNITEVAAKLKAMIDKTKK